MMRLFPVLFVLALAATPANAQNNFMSPVTFQGGADVRNGTLTSRHNLSVTMDGGIGGNLTVNGNTIAKGTLLSQGALSTTLGASVGTNLTVTMDAGILGNATVNGILTVKGTTALEGAATALSMHATSTVNGGSVLLGDAGTGIPTATATVTSGSHCACSNETWAVLPAAVTCSVATTTLTIKSAPGGETTASYVCF